MLFRDSLGPDVNNNHVERKYMAKFKITNGSPPFFYNTSCLAHQKKEPEPSGEGPGMIRPVVPGAWA